MLRRPDTSTGGWRSTTAVNVSATTDAEGRFSLTLLDGVPYELFAYQVRTPRLELAPGRERGR
jgi:hypothetical protein